MPGSVDSSVHAMHTSALTLARGPCAAPVLMSPVCAMTAEAAELDYFCSKQQTSAGGPFRAELDPANLYQLILMLNKSPPIQLPL